jgi:hypothetical protein
VNQHHHDTDELLRELFCRLLCRHHHPQPRVLVRLSFGRTSLSFEGDFTMQLPDDSQVHADVTYVDKKGNPATIDGTPTWSTDRPDLIAIVAAADGFSADIAAVGPLGSAQVVVDADADLGAGVVSVKTLGTIEVIGGQATTGVINFGEPTPAP